MDPFPVDDETLALIDRALDASVTGRTSMSALLGMLSGYDPQKQRPALDDAGREVPDIVEYPDPIYHEHDVVRALMAEVRRLRANDRREEPGGVEMTDEEIARVTHEANRALQQIQGDPVPSPPWDDAPEWQRDSAVDGVKAALAGATPEQLHENWLRFKEAGGWIYGETKSQAAKTHPCMLPYDQLPPDQRLKDDLFAAIVRALGSG